jgi:hypothetical protein
MTGKSRHSRKKHAVPVRRQRKGHSPLATIARHHITAQESVPTSSSGKVDSKISMLAPSTSPITDYSYIIADLKRIGIVTGLIMVILILLFFLIR